MRGGGEAEKMSSVSWLKRLEVEEREVLRRERRNHLKQVLEEEEEDEEDLKKTSNWEQVLEQEDLFWRRSLCKEVLQERDRDEVLRRRSRWKEVLVTVESLFGGPIVVSTVILGRGLAPRTTVPGPDRTS